MRISTGFAVNRPNTVKPLNFSGSLEAHQGESPSVGLKLGPREANERALIDPELDRFLKETGGALRKGEYVTRSGENSSFNRAEKVRERLFWKQHQKLHAEQEQENPFASTEAPGNIKKPKTEAQKAAAKRKKARQKERKQEQKKAAQSAGS